MRTRFELARWKACANASPQGETILAQGVPGLPTRAVFARVGVVKPWVSVGKMNESRRDGTFLT